MKNIAKNVLASALATVVIAFVSCSTNVNGPTSPTDQLSDIQQLTATKIASPATGPDNVAKAPGKTATLPSSELTLSAVGGFGEFTGGDSTGGYTWLAGDGFLCQRDQTACPILTEASNGDRLALTGQGTISLDAHTAAGGGTLEERDSQGNTVATGTWTIIQLLNFHNYGAIHEEGMPAGSYGGRLMARIHVTMDNGLDANGMVRITSAQGDHVPSGQRDGVILNVPGVARYTQSISGGTVFMLQ